jgi:CheY-like chemotaxis protein
VALVALSGSTTIDDHDAVNAAGFDAYIDKPFSFEELLRIVQKYLGEADAPD